VPKALDITFQRFGRLVAMHRGPSTEHKNTRWVCVCDCGNEKLVHTTHLRSGRSQSCGCLSKEITSAQRKTHGQSRTTLFRRWAGMINRCHNPETERYKDYGARGITVCKRWHSFENFLADMGEPPPGMTLDRINNDWGYGPFNCRWATRTEQARNKRSNRVIDAGDGPMSTAEAAERYGIKPSSLSWRLNHGWTDYEAIHGKQV